MNRTIIILLFILKSTFTYSQSLPVLFANNFKKQRLDEKYILNPFVKPAFLEADFNGDGNKDVVATIIEKKTLKRGLLLIHGVTNRVYVFGASVKFGKTHGENYDDLNWIKGWRVNRNEYLYETIFSKDGDMVGSKKIKIRTPGISIWDLMDGEPNSGGTLYWEGKKYAWIHEGE